MNGRDAILALGMNHRTAEVEVRERFALSVEGRQRVRRALADDFDLTESVLISTCNRTELYVCGEVEKVDRNRLARLVFPALEEHHRPYLHDGWNAVFHLFRVAAGLDSMIVGESEILRQVKLAFEESLETGDPGRILKDVFRQSLRVGKRVRSETEVGRGSLSVAATAVGLAEKIVGDLAGKRALIVGAGETGLLAGRHLVAAGIETLVVLNRTRERAQEAAEELGGTAGGLDQLGPELERADVVVGCIERDEPIITPELVGHVLRRTRCIIDISVPRSVVPEVGEIAGVFAFDIDDVGVLIEQSQRDRLSQLDEVNEIIVDDFHSLLARLSYAEMSPLVGRVQSSFDEVLAAVLDQTERRSMDSEETARVLSKRLLGVALDALKETNRGRHDQGRILAAYEAFVRTSERRP